MNQSELPCEHIVFLIHPCCYEGLGPEEIRRDNLNLYVEREQEVRERWLATMAELPRHTLFVQLGGPAYLRDAAEIHLGSAFVFYPKTRFPDDGDRRTYYQDLADDFRTHVSTHRLRFEPATVTSELWGESFEGCVPGYAGAFAEYLRLEIPPKMRFEMTVYDSRFLHGARRWETVQIADSDVEAWLFECHDLTCAANFQSRLTAQWLDERKVYLRLDDRRIQVCNKQSHTLWPPEPWEKGKLEQVLEYSMTLAECNWRWIRSIGMEFDDFRSVIHSAEVRA